MRNINLFRLRIKTFLPSDVSLLHAPLPIMQDTKLANNFSTLCRRNILAKGIAAIKKLISYYYIFDTYRFQSIKFPGVQHLLEQKDYFSRKNKRLNNYELYQYFYQLL